MPCFFFLHEVALQFVYFFLSLKDKIITKVFLSDVSLRYVSLLSKRKYYMWKGQHVPYIWK